MIEVRPSMRTRSPIFSLRPLPQTMRAAVIAAPKKIEIQEVAVPQPGPGQVLVKLEGCGVCASNLPVWEGREWFNYPIEPGGPGHEGWGWVAAVGEGVENVAVGNRVAVLSYHAYAEYDVADSSAVVVLPPELENVPFPAEPLGCAVNVFRRSGIEAGHKVAIIGIGFLGALLTSLATAAGAEVIALSRRKFALNLARQMGAAHTVSLHQEQWQIVEQVKQIAGDDLCDVVIEAVGKQQPLDLAAELTKIRGRLVVAGYHQDGLRQVNMQLWNWRGIDVINAHERDPAIYQEGMKLAVEAAQRGEIDPSPLCTHIFGLSELGDALAMMQQRPDGFLKALIMM